MNCAKITGTRDTKRRSAFGPFRNNGCIFSNKVSLYVQIVITRGSDLIGGGGKIRWVCELTVYVSISRFHYSIMITGIISCEEWRLHWHLRCWNHHPWLPPVPSWWTAGATCRGRCPPGPASPHAWCESKLKSIISTKRAKAAYLPLSMISPSLSTKMQSAWVMVLSLWATINVVRSLHADCKAFWSEQICGNTGANNEPWIIWLSGY